MWRRAALVSIGVALCGQLACGGNAPTAPQASTLPLIEGRKLLTLSGFALSSDPSFPPCSPIGQPRDGTSVSTLVVLSLENGTWTARSTSGFGTIELRLRDAGASPTGYAVTGTITGTAMDAGVMGVNRDVRVTLASSSGDAATFDGASTAQGSMLLAGRVAGAIRFADSAGTSSTCPAVQWTMQPF